MFKLRSNIRRPRWPLSLAAASFALAVLAAGGSDPATAALISYDLKNHPASAESPPPYGLRVDGVEWWATNGAHGGNSDTWTFDFEPGAACITCGVVGTLDTVANTFVISGTAWGGKDVGATYAPAPGPGRLEIDFTYVNVTIGTHNGHPSVTVFGNPHGTGTIKFLDDNQSIGKDTVVHLLGHPPGMKPFVFKADDHRLAGYCPHPACDDPVGRGWLKFVKYNPHGTITAHHKTSYQDWLFTSQRVPEPSTLAMFGAGLAGLGLAGWCRRRRPKNRTA